MVIINNFSHHYFWDGNVLLHERHYDLKQRPRLKVTDDDLVYDKKEPIENLITWVYEEGSFAPCAKIVGEERYSIINDYIGRPIQAYSSNGNLVWQTDYDIYGKLRNFSSPPSEGLGEDFIPFRQLGQYEDVETGLYYNRFRYYSPDSGLYISQDPIGLAGARTNLYSFVRDSNSWVDIFGQIGENFDWGGYLKGLIGDPPADMLNPHAHHIVFKNGNGPLQKSIIDKSKAILEKYEIDWLKGKENLVWAPNTKGIHTKDAAQKVLDALQKADLEGTKEAVVSALEKLGKSFADMSICN